MTAEPTAETSYMFDVCDWSSVLTRNNFRCATKLNAPVPSPAISHAAFGRDTAYGRDIERKKMKEEDFSKQFVKGVSTEIVKEVSAGVRSSLRKSPEDPEQIPKGLLHIRPGQLLTA